MNIFVLDLDPQKAAEYHNDKHCVKMIIESAQLLSTAIHYEQVFHAMDGEFIKINLPLYDRTHDNHPCSLWTRKSKENFNWLASLAFYLCREYTTRYGKIHKSQYLIDNISKFSYLFDDIGLTDFAQAMPDEYRNKCPVTAYRNYYMGDKRHLANWKTQQPFWWK